MGVEASAWASTLVWGQSYKETHDNTVNSWLAESLLHLGKRHSISLRVERADKDELFPHRHGPKIERPPLPVPTFRIDAATLGYTFDLHVSSQLRTGIGATHTVYRYPSLLEPFYGKDARTTIVYLRVRL